MFMRTLTSRSRCGRTTGSRHDDAFGERDAGQRAELRVAALDQLREARRVSRVADGAGARRRELAAVAGQRAALGLVVRRDTSTTNDGGAESLMK